MIRAATRSVICSSGSSYFGFPGIVRMRFRRLREERLGILRPGRRAEVVDALLLADQLVDQRFQLPRAPDVLLMRPLVLRSGLHGPLPHLNPAHAQTIVRVEDLSRGRLHQMTRFSDWSGYVAQTTGTPPRPLYQRAVALFDTPGTAVDLGCGAGNETLDLLNRGWSVHAVDSSEAAIQTVTDRATTLPGCVQGDRR